MTTPSNSYDTSLKEIADQIIAKSNAQIVNFVTVWGASGTGKSTLAHQLANLIPGSSVFPIDHYLSSSLKSSTYNHINPESSIPYIEGLDPNIWDQKLINYHLNELKNNQPISMPIFNHQTRERISSSTFPASNIIIVEGVYSFDNVISDSAIMSIVINTSFHDRFLRKLVRTYCINKRTDLDESIERYITRTQPSTDYYLEIYSLKANFIIETASNPALEFDKYKGSTFHRHPSDHTYNLIPKESYGILHPEENLIVNHHDKSINSTLTYTLDNKIIFTAKLRSKHLDLLRRYYTFKDY
ncbi:MAG TPA: hypothetical protein VF281_00910 [Candidatus Saccharimonadales bacterium]